MQENSRPRILVFEDDTGWQDHIKSLEPLAHMRTEDPNSVVVVATLKDALLNLESNEFSLAITDVFIEGKSEFEWRYLADILQRKNIPIIVVSGMLKVKLITAMVNKYNVKGLFNKLQLDPQQSLNPE